MSCSFCGESGQKPVYCGTCAGNLFLRKRISLIKAMDQIATLQANVDTVMKDSRRAIAFTSTGPSDARTGLLDAKILALRAKLDQTSRAVLQCRVETQQVYEKVGRIKAASAAAGKATATLKKSHANEQKSIIEHTKGQISELEKNYRNIYHQTLPLQAAACKNLLDLFMLKKKRKKSQEYDVVLGFSTIPEVSQLGQYSYPVINAGFEGLAYFTVLLASYLGIYLPYPILLPSKSQPFLRVGPEKQKLHLSRALKEIMVGNRAEFHDYCRGLAMVTLDVAFVAARIGVVNLDFIATTRANYLAAQLYMWLDGYVKKGHQIQVHAVALNTDLDAIQDHFVSLIDININGKSEEWDLVHAPDGEQD